MTINLLSFMIQWEQLLYIAIFYFSAWLIYRLSTRIANRFLRLNWLTSRHRYLSLQRQETLRSLIAGVITFIAFLAATLLTLSLFIDTDTLIWMVGLFSAAFGLGARPLVSDFLAGISFIFENAFEVGEKVELLGLPGSIAIEGAVEAVHLRYTLIRATTGEPYVVPNGEIRIVRNFSRGRFSPANIKLKIATTELNRALPLLEQLGQEAVAALPNLLEPWRVISESGEIGQQTELTLVAKARFGNAAEMRPRLLTLVQEHLAEAGISLVG